MMINNVNIVGRLTKDFDIKALKNNKFLVRFDIAFNMYYNKAEDEEESGFIKVVAVYKNENFANKYLKKGKKVSINGKLMYKQYNEKNGNTKSTIYIKATNIDVL